VCMPRFYVSNTDPIAGYSLFIIALNFISFIYVCISYIFVYKVASQRPNISSRQVDVQNQKMQNRITRLLITDFFCWIPICITAFVKFATNIELPIDIYAATIAFLLPINSAINPILYSPIFEKLYQNFKKKTREWRQKLQGTSMKNSKWSFALQPKTQVSYNHTNAPVS